MDALTPRELFLAGLEAEYHDDVALRALTDPPAEPPTSSAVLRQLADEGWFGAEVIQRRMDLYGDLEP